MPSLVASSPAVQQVRRAHWRRVLWFSAALLLVWALVSLGCGVWFADELNGVMLGGFPLGFWFAQQGSIASFVMLVLAYGLVMNRVDRRHHDELARIRRAESTPGGGSPGR